NVRTQEVFRSEQRRLCRLSMIRPNPVYRSCQCFRNLPCAGTRRWTRICQSGPKSAEELPDHREGKGAVPKRFPQCLQPCKPQHSELGPRKHDGCNGYVLESSSHRVCAQALLLSALI